MANNLHGRTVRITASMAEFVGVRGTIIDREQDRPPMYRIRLDRPVMVPGVGEVRDDLWERGGFKLLRD
jgi:hypothetical protein